MLLPRVSETLETIIVTVLAESGFVTAAELHSLIDGRYRHYTLRAVYKELAKLQNAGVLIKVKGRYGLRFDWVLETANGIDVLYDNYTNHSHVSEFLPAPGEKKVWRINSLRKMDSLWLNLMLLLFHHYRRKHMFQWVPHPWFHMFLYESEPQFQQAMRLGGHKMFVIVGGSDHLDPCFRSYWAEDVYEVAAANGSFEESYSHYLHAIGEFVLSIILDEETARQVARLFGPKSGGVSAQMPEMLELFRRKVNVKVVLEHNEHKAERIKAKFALFFGVPSEDF